MYVSVFVLASKFTFIFTSKCEIFTQCETNPINTRPAKRENKTIKLPNIIKTK